MAVNKSKQKGATFELKVSKILTEHFGIKCVRVPLSGALSWIKGDVFFPEKMETFEYCIECKFYEKLDFNSLITAKSNDIFKFWDQTTSQAKKMNKKPLLIFKWNRSKEFIAWDDKLILETQLEVKAFKYNFKIGLLKDWLNNCKLKLS